MNPVQLAKEMYVLRMMENADIGWTRELAENAWNPELKDCGRFILEARTAIAAIRSLQRQFFISGRQLQHEISEWADSTFGPVSSNAGIAARANKEMSELLMALSSDDYDPKAGEEIADVVMVLMRLSERMNIDMLAEIVSKLAINRKRKWRLTGDGHGYHVKDDQLSSAAAETGDEQ